MDCRSVIPTRCDVEIEGIFLGIAAEGERCPNQVSNLVHLVSGSERALGVGESFGQYQKSVAHLRLACLIPVGDFEPARTAGLRDRDGVLQGMNLLDILWIIWLDEYADPKGDI